MKRRWPLLAAAAALALAGVSWVAVRAVLAYMEATEELLNGFAAGFGDDGGDDDAEL